jgi:glycosyltransferase involved in cell wall biosynthesis
LKPICLVSEPFLDHIGGAESHAWAFAHTFDEDPEYELRSVLVPQIPRSKGYVACRERGRKWRALDLDRGKVLPVLTRNPVTDAREIAARTDLAKTFFFLNGTPWTPLAAALKRLNPASRIVARSGGNDLMAGWMSRDLPGSLCARLERRLKGKLRHLLAKRKALLWDCVEQRAGLVKIINTCVDRLIANSEYSLDRIIELGVHPSRLLKITGGVDCACFHPPLQTTGDEVVVLTAARLVAFKGLEFSLRAFAEVATQTCGVRYLVAGDGPERERLRSLASDLAIRQDVEFLGAVPLESMPEVYRRADIYLGLPVELAYHRGNLTYVHTETMGRSFCEAAASGLPAIGSLVGGVPEVIVDGRTGILVPERDSDRASTALAKMITDEDLRRHMGRAARIHAEAHFDWSKVFGKYRELFRELESRPGLA